jgi:CheY-like chemotaxis protein
MSSDERYPGIVLLVEDDQAVRRVITTILEEDGWRVEEAADGWEGWEMARALNPHLIVTDLNLPGMSGLEMTERLRDVDEVEAPVVAITANESGFRRNAEASGLFVDVLRKPFDPARFLDLVRLSARRPPGGEDVT